MLMNPELEAQGIGSLPKAPAKLPRIPSGELYDATLEAVGQMAPEAVNEYRGAMRTAMSDVEISPQMVDILIAMFEYLIDHKDEYEQIVSTLVQNGIVPPSMLPDQFDQTYIGTRLAALHELKKDTAERSMPMEGMPMAQGGLADVTRYLQSQGRNGDTMLAHITPEEAQLLKAFGGSGSINPDTGLHEFFNPLKEIRNAVSSVSNALAKVDDGLHKVVASPIGRLVATIGLTMIGVPPWLASAGLTAYSGGNLKDVLISGAMGYLGSGGTVMGVSPLGEIAKFMPGTAGSLLNSGLASGTLGMGVGLLRGQSLGEALKSGAMAGVTTAGLQGMGLSAPNPNASPSQYQTFTTPDTGGNNAPQYINGELSPISGTSGIGGIPSAEQLGQSLDTKVNAEQLGKDFGLHPSVVKSYEAVQNVPAPQGEGLPNAPAQTTSVSPSPYTTNLPPAGSGTVGGFTMGDNEGLNPATAGAKAGSTESSLISRAQDFYNKPSFDSFGKIFTDPNATTMLGKYGPGAAAVLGATALAGGFKSKPSEKNPAFNSQYTGSNYIKDNPQLFSGNLRSGQFSNTQPIAVPTNNFQMGIPMPQVNAPMLPTYSPGPLTNMPGGVPQPYNRPYATGGDVNHFPRKIGQIDGPGTETSDSIPAMLSDGEFVFTAKAVRNAGGGSRRKGAAKMYKLMKSLENGPLGSN
jgi:hypothetical protein